jgi:hypothetical protein
MFYFLLTYKNILFITALGIIATVALVIFDFSYVYAEEREGYNVAENVKANFTFTF